MTAAKQPSKSYRDLNEELEAIIQQLQREDLDVDQAVKDYEQGLKLINQLEDYLKTAENKIVELQAKFISDR
jgi:exodeoxyribonuclease VII small subunit